MVTIISDAHWHLIAKAYIQVTECLQPTMKFQRASGRLIQWFNDGRITCNKTYLKCGSSFTIGSSVFRWPIQKWTLKSGRKVSKRFSDVTTFYLILKFTRTTTRTNSYIYDNLHTFKWYDLTLYRTLLFDGPLKTLWEKEKMLVSSIFPLFIMFSNLSKINRLFGYFYFVICQCFRLGQG